MKEIVTNDEYARERFRYLYKRTDKANPKQEDVRALQVFLAEHPEIIQDTYYLPKMVLDEFLEKLYDSESKRALIIAQVEELKAQFGYEQVSIIEKMLFDSVLISWVRLNYLEGCYNQYFQAGSPYKDFEFWEQRVSAAQRRFTRAIDTLGRLKKFNINFQINIANEGSQQVNIQDNKQPMI